MLLLLWGGSSFIYDQGVDEHLPESLLKDLVEDWVSALVQEIVANSQSGSSLVQRCLTCCLAAFINCL
jgi:hypothetical protein